MSNQSLIYRIGLTLVSGIGTAIAKNIIKHLEEPELLFTEQPHILEKIPGVNARILAEIKNPAVLQRAEQEALFLERHKIQAIYIRDENYPFRFRGYPDSPVMLYFRGNVDLNAGKIISIVGTRNATAYGRDTTDRIISDLAAEYKDLLVISGLAYGIDYYAHQAALREQLPTVGVLAHGLDMIYPYQHRQLAIEMLGAGGLLTDYISETKPERQNFVKRNRIVAGLSDCTLVVESAARGGALITANLAQSYNKPLFAVPGRASDVYSQGCNALIREKKAVLVETGEDIMKEMNWNISLQTNRPEPAPQRVLPDLPPEQQQIVALLSQAESVHLNTLSIELDLPISNLLATLFDMELDGVVKAIPGGSYKMI